MALSQTQATMVLGPRSNSKQMVFGVPAGPIADTPGILCLESVSDALVYARVYLWADDTNNLRYSTTLPTDENGSGSVLATTAATGANYTLSNLGTVAINTTLLSDTTATDDLGTSAVYWRAGYLATLYLTAEWHITATTGVATVAAGGSITLADGDLVITEGKVTVTTVTDEQCVITRNQATTTAPFVVIQSAATSDDYPGLHVDFNGTGAINAMNITTDAAGGYGLSITTANAAGNGLGVIGPASTTASLAVIDGKTGSWLGANGVGMLHIKADGTLAHANASLLNITHDGAVAANALGSSLRIIDTATASGTSYTAHITSSTNSLLYLLTTTATTTTALTVKGTTSHAAALVKIDGTNWIGAAAVGCVHISGDGVLEAGASLLNVTSTAANTAASYLVLLTASGNFAGSTNGTALRVVDSGAAAGTSYGLYVTSTANHTAAFATGAVGKTCLTMAPVTASTAAVIDVPAGAWVGANGVGAVTISGSGTHAHANASLLLIANSSATGTASALGTSLRITDSSGAAAGCYVAYVTSTNNTLLGLVGVAVAKNQLYIGGPASQTASMVNVVSTNINATDIGTVHISNTGNQAHANATDLYVEHKTGTIAANSVGAVARFIDASAAAATSYAVQVKSTANGCLNITSGSTAYAGLNITSAAATASVVKVATTSVNATDVGTLHISGTGNLAHANATELYVYHGTGTVAANSLGCIARFVDASAAAATSYAVQMTSTANGILRLTGVATAYPALYISAGANTASVVSIASAAVMASDVGLVHIANTGTLAHANATLLYVSQGTGTIANATLGACARFIDTTAAATTSAAVQISSTNNRALACTLGQADFIKGMSTMCSTAACAGATPTAAEMVTAFGNANTHTTGFIGVLDTGDTKCFLVFTNGTNYFYSAAMTKGA